MLRLLHPSPSLARRAQRAALAFIISLVSQEIQPPLEAPADAPAPPGGGSAPVAVLLKDPAPLIAWLEARNQDMAASSSRLQQAEAGLAASRLYPNPALSYALSNIPAGETNPPNLGYHDTAIAGYVLSQTFEIGKRGPRIASARLARDSAAEDYLDTLGLRVADARYALGRAVYLRARQEILEQSLSSAKVVLDLERTRMEQGDVSGNDYDRLRLDTLTLETDTLRNRAAYEAALAACPGVLFAPCDPGFARVEDLDAAAALPALDDTEALLALRPDIQATGRQRDGAREAARLARRRRLPDLNLGVGYTHDNFTIAGDLGTSVLLTASIPLPLFDRGQHESARQEARALELESVSRSALQAARSALEGLLDRKAFLEQTLGTLESEALPKSSGILDATTQAFNQGQVSMTDLLLARRTHTALLSNLIDLRFEYFSVRNEIRQVLGLDAEIARQSRQKDG